MYPASLAQLKSIPIQIHQVIKIKKKSKLPKKGIRSRKLSGVRLFCLNADIVGNNEPSIMKYLTYPTPGIKGQESLI